MSVIIYVNIDETKYDNFYVTFFCSYFIKEITIWDGSGGTLIILFLFIIIFVHIDLETQNMYVRDLIEQIYTLKCQKKPVVYSWT